MQFMEAGITLGNSGGMSRATNTLRFEDIFTTKSEHCGQFFPPSILAKSCTAYTHISLHNNIPSVVFAFAHVNKQRAKLPERQRTL